MGSVSGISEIEESSGKSHYVLTSKECGSVCYTSKQGNNTRKQLVSIISHDYSVERQITHLFESIEFKATSHGLESLAGSSWKNNTKRPMRVGLTQTSAIGISEVVTLKQALRGLCISHASELASLRRKIKPVGLPSSAEIVAPKQLCGTVVVQVGESSQSAGTNAVSTVACNGTLFNPKMCNPSVISGDDSKQEITIVPDNSNCNSSGQISTSRQSPTHSLAMPKPGSTLSTAVEETLLRPIKTKHSGREANISSQSRSRMSMPKLLHHVKVVSASSTSSGSPTVHSEISSCTEGPHLKKFVRRTKKSSPENEKKDIDVKSEGPIPNKNFVANGTISGSCSSKNSSLPNNTNKRKVASETCSPASNASNSHAGIVLHNSESNAVEYHEPLPASCQCEHGIEKIQNPKPNEKGECSQSSLSSIGEYSSSSGISDESGASISSFNGNRPHMSKDSRWSAIRHVEMYHGVLGLRHFKLVKRLGCGDIGSVYLAALMGTDAQFALKVMDIDFLMSRKKMLRAQTEREILQMLDHPFLPTLYAHFATDKLLCLVMEYCPGGDLHVLRQRQPGRSFPEQAARFYAAEVLLALEYLHMLGVIYRDLKPENILVRDDGHIMLSDFDLSLRCAVNPTLVGSSFVSLEGPRLSEVCAPPRCIDPLCPEPRWAPVSCFTPKLMPVSAKAPRSKVDPSTHPALLPQLVVEPTSARSNSFVGTHEYLAPEIIRGDGHGSSVDWWTFGIFLFELIYGKTPFKGADNQETLANAVSQNLQFPESPPASHHVKDLITGLLSKDPESRIGSVRGAAEIKSHPFFEGLNWALIRSTTPPEVAKTGQFVIHALTSSSQVNNVNNSNKKKLLESKTMGQQQVEHF